MNDMNDREFDYQVTNQPTGKLGLIKEFMAFLGETKKWWLAPIVIFVILLGILIILTEGSAVTPLIYTIF